MVVANGRNGKRNGWTVWTDRVLSFLTWICAAWLVWLSLQVFCFAGFKIPTPSMAPALLPGDRIWVNKWLMGPRIFNVSDAMEGKKVNIHRLPGIGKVQRNDVLVFNFPHHHRWDSISMDMTVYYVKRCIGLPGDSVRIRNSRYGVSGVTDTLGNFPAQQQLERLMASGKAESMGIAVRSFPEDSLFDWNIRDFGPLFVPFSGSRVRMTGKNAVLYRKVIEWEQMKKLTRKGSDVLLGDSLITEYRFEKDYYFVGGDNVLHSQDSRYWGLLPEEYIVGKATKIWRKGKWISLTEK